MTHRDRPTIAVFVIVVALISACGATDAPAPSVVETAASPEIDQLLGDYFAAYKDYDADAVRAVITDGYVLYEGGSYDPDRNVSTPACQAYNAAQMLSNPLNYISSFFLALATSSMVRPAFSACHHTGLGSAASTA